MFIVLHKKANENQYLGGTFNDFNSAYIEFSGDSNTKELKSLVGKNMRKNLFEAFTIKNNETRLSTITYVKA